VCSQSHSIDDKLHGQVLAVGRHTSGAEGWASSVVLAVLVDQVPHHLVEHIGPGLADAVYLVQGVERGVGERVGGQAGAVEVGANAGGLRHVSLITHSLAASSETHVIDEPRAHRIVGGTSVAFLQADSGGHEVTPALTHTAGLERVQAVGVGRSTSKAVGNSVSELVDDDAGLK